MLIALLAQARAQAYSQFSHEELIDLVWDDTIRPLLLERYPQTTPEELAVAHGFAYGGCLIQDVGYYPFGKRLFSDLAHYVRSGDFVGSLIKNARNPSELAFAIGALSHYIGDAVGHSVAVNPAVASTFPDLHRRFGDVITYEDSPTAHVRTEFGFDVAETVWGLYAPRAYRKRMGFRVARQLLYRSFSETYGLSARGILGPARAAVASYRWSVAALMPAFLGAQIVLIRSKLPPEPADAVSSVLCTEVAQSDYAATGLSRTPRPGIRAHLFAGLIRIVPKIGILKVIAIRAPVISTEFLFEKSLLASVAELRADIASAVRQGSASPRLANLDLDTGMNTAPGASRMADATHLELLIAIAAKRRSVSPELARYLLDYFHEPAVVARIVPDLKPRRKTDGALAYLRAAVLKPKE